MTSFVKSGSRQAITQLRFEETLWSTICCSRSAFNAARSLPEMHLDDMSNALLRVFSVARVPMMVFGKALVQCFSAGFGAAGTLELSSHRSPRCAVCS